MKDVQKIGLLIKKLLGFIKQNKIAQTTEGRSYKLSDDEVRRLKMLYPPKNGNIIKKLVERLAKSFLVR